MKIWKVLALCFLILPLVVGAETISWTPPTTYTDGTTIDAATKATLVYYLRGGKEGVNVKTYFGETRNGTATWTDNILVRMNQWGATVAGWVVLKPGDNVLVTLSTSLPYLDNTGVVKEIDGPESAPYRWTIPAPAPPPWKPPPSCSIPTGISIKE